MRLTWLAVLVVAGCGSTMVNAPGVASQSAYAPVNEAQRPGLVSYLNQGAGFVIRARRDDAYRQMFTACAGAYRIDGEGAQTSGGVLAPVGNSAVFIPSQYWYIQFSCLTPPVAAAQAALASPAKPPAPNPARLD